MLSNKQVNQKVVMIQLDVDMMLEKNKRKTQEVIDPSSLKNLVLGVYSITLQELMSINQVGLSPRSVSQLRLL